MATISFLKNLNSHERDAYIEFFEIGHKYSIHLPKKQDQDEDQVQKESKEPTNYTSVTTWIHSHFPHFDSDKIIKKMLESKNYREGHKYWGMSPKEIKQKWSNDAQLGTNLHARIEHFMNDHAASIFFKTFDISHKKLLQQYYFSLANNENAKEGESSEPKEGESSEPKEWQYFLQFVNDTPDLVPYRTEWMIFHEDIHIAGSIDMVYVNTKTGKLAIYDWKRCLDITPENPFRQFAHAECIATMPDNKFWHYALQLNLYKRILEDKYDKEVSELYLIRLHPTADTYEKIEVPNLQEEIEKMIQAKQQKKI
jgi:hypothetical protein